MKQAFVVPIYQNDPDNFITHVVRSPLNSKRIASVHIASMLIDGTRQTDKMSDNDLIGIFVDGVEVLPDNFPASLLNAQYFSRFQDIPESELVALNSKFPSFTAFPVDKPCEGSKIEIRYKTSYSNFVIVFECDDEPYSSKNVCYHVENIRREANEWMQASEMWPAIRLSLQKMLKRTHISLSGIPTAIAGRAVINGLIEDLNMWAVGNNGNSYWATVFPNGSTNYSRLNFPSYLMTSGQGSNLQSFLLKQWLEKTIINVKTADGVIQLDDLNIPLISPTSKISLNESFLPINTVTKSIDLEAYMPTFITPSFYVETRDEIPFTDAYVQIIIKYEK